MCSRRAADRLIESGAVTLNGKTAQLGLTVEDGDEVCVSGKLIKAAESFEYLLVYKPSGITSTTDTADKDNIIDYVNYEKRLFTVGRLDKDSEGAILLTDNGNCVNALLRSENEHEKVYRVRVDKPIGQQFLKVMAAGVEIYNPVSDQRVITKPCKIIATGENIFEITLTQGYNRQIRRMCQALGYTVTSLLRTRFLFLTLDGLKKGGWRKLTAEEKNKIETITARELSKQS